MPAGNLQLPVGRYPPYIAKCNLSGGGIETTTTTSTPVTTPTTTIVGGSTTTVYSTTTTALLEDCMLYMSVTPADGGTTSPLVGSHFIQDCSPDNMTITAYPALGYHFSKWEGSIQSQDNPATISIHGTPYVTAVFVADNSTTTTSIIFSTTTTSAGGENTTTTTTGGLCPAQKILGPDNPKLEILRNFRDSKLAHSAVGRRIIWVYYANADSINAALDRSPALRAFVRRGFETIAPVVEKKE